MAVTSVASSASSVTLLAANSGRASVTITNDDANRLYVLMDSAAATTSNYSFSLAQNENAHVAGKVAQSEFRGIWSSAGAGGARITAA